MATQPRIYEKKDITRTDAAAKNLRASVAGIFINLILSFFSRKVFVLVLGKEFVGLGSLIGNMTAVLSLLDFGASSAAIYRLYKPLAQKDYYSVSAYLACYRKLCFISASITMAAGLFLMPYLPNMVEDFRDTKTLYSVFFIYLLSNSIGYLFSSEKLLVFADQKNYISQIFSYFFGAITVLFESAALLLTKNYIVYLSVHTLLCVTEDIFLISYIRRLYSEISFRGKPPEDKKYMRSLRREILFLQPSNIGGTLLRTADNFIVVYLFGVAANGIYSNYNMLLSYASMLSVTLIGALSASVGNLGAAASVKRAEEVFGMTGLASFILVNICTSVLFVMSGDIITVWLGSSLALPMQVSCILAMHFFVNGLRRTVMIFRDGYGLYRKERIKPFLELICSLGFSAYFGKKMGLGGIYLGQMLTSFIICLWYEPYILYKYGFSRSVLPYYAKLIKYGITSVFSCACSYSLCRYIPSFSIRAAVCITVPLLFSIAAFASSKDLKNAISRIISRRKGSANIVKTNKRF